MNLVEWGVFKKGIGVMGDRASRHGTLFRHFANISAKILIIPLILQFRFR